MFGFQTSLYLHLSMKCSFDTFGCRLYGLETDKNNLFNPGSKILKWFGKVHVLEERPAQKFETNKFKNLGYLLVRNFFELF